MKFEADIDGIRYSLDTDEQEATVKRCVDKKREGEVVIPESFFHEGIVYRVTSIGDNAFSWCSSLTSITIPEGVTSIGKCAFERCRRLTSITIPESVNSIGDAISQGCSRLTTIVVEEGSKVYDSRGGCNAIIETNTNTLIQGCSATIIPDSVTNIGKRAFCECDNLTAITLPKGVKSIGNLAFGWCPKLTSITLPESVTSIGDEAFQGCSSLTAIALPEGVTSIGKGLFEDCRNLTSVTIPKSVTSIGEGAFHYCESLATIHIPENSQLASIKAGAFCECSSLTAITLPENVTTIGDSAFEGCSILTIITIPKSVSSIGEGVFHRCSSLTTIIVEEGSNIYDSRNGCNAIVETSSNTLIQGCSSTTIPESVSRIGGYAFGCCTKFAVITLPKKLTSIGNYAFGWCESLTSILIPKSVGSIGKLAFKESGITYLTMLGKPTIDKEAFAGCEKLTDVYCYSEEVPPTNDNAFGNLNLSRITLHVPESALEAYKNTEPWSRFGTIVAIK